MINNNNIIVHVNAASNSKSYALHCISVPPILHLALSKSNSVVGLEEGEY